MNVYTSKDIRNVVILGHGGCGKTTLIEGIAYTAGLISRMKTVEEGGTVSDFDKEEIKRKFSIQTTMLPVEWEGVKINFLDTPGFFDFCGEVHEALSVADAAVIVVSGKSGVEVGTLKAFEFCKRYQIPSLVFVTDMDDDNANFMKIVNSLKEKYGNVIAPFYLPIYENEKFVGFNNIVKMAGRIFKEDGSFVDSDTVSVMDDNLITCRNMLLEAVAETSEEYMERYFDGDTFTQEEITDALRENVIDGTIIPVLMGSGIMTYGIRMLLYCIRKYLPAPEKESKTLVGSFVKTEEPYAADYDEEKPVSAYIFKTLMDPFIGKYSFFKVCSGVIRSDDTLYNVNKEVEERLGKLYVFRGKEAIEVKELHAGDIGAVAKLSETKTGDTLTVKGNPIQFEQTYHPIPYTFMRYVAKTKGDEDKISVALHKLMDEDLTLREVNDKENHQTLLYGIGEQQLEVAVSKLFNRYKVEVELIKPKVAYKETIRKKVKVQGKYKKQSGGHGQYGDVHMEFEPSGDLEKPYVFEEKIFGGAVPKNYFPAVEKGIQESCLKGPLAGYPVVGIKATLVDGSYHPVDSSEMAFKMAAITAFKNGIMEAQPVLLEPIMSIKVVVNDTQTGDVMGDLNKRRGRVLGMNPYEDGRQEIIADIPMSGLIGYSTVLRSMTGGSGEYSYGFSRYEQMPSDVQTKILAEIEYEKNEKR